MKRKLLGNPLTAIAYDPVEMLPTLGPVGIAAFLVCRSLQAAWVSMHCVNKKNESRPTAE